LYTFGVDFLDREFKSIPLGSNIVITGPPMVGKSVLARRVFYKALVENGGGIYITTKDTAPQLNDWFRLNDMSLTPYETKVGIIDCISKSLDFSIGERASNVIEVSSAVDLNGISIALNRFLTKFIKQLQLKKTVVVVESLSNLLMFSNLQAVYRFLYVFAGRVRAAGCAGMYILDSGLHTPETLATVRQVSQGVIEMNSDSDGNYLTTSGMSNVKQKVYYNIYGGTIREV